METTFESTTKTMLKLDELDRLICATQHVTARDVIYMRILARIIVSMMPAEKIGNIYVYINDDDRGVNCESTDVGIICDYIDYCNS